MCVPAPKLLTVHWARPPETVTDAQTLIVALPSRNTAVPLGATPLIVAVQVTLSPANDGFKELSRTAELGFLLTFWTNVLPSEAVLLASPL